MTQPTDPAIARQYGVPDHAGHDPNDPDHPANPRAAGDPEVTASYWAGLLQSDGTPAYVWNCDACTAGMGAAPTEAEAIIAMNEHVASAHPGASYVPTAVPDTT